jgi:hypothetical protein
VGIRRVGVHHRSVVVFKIAPVQLLLLADFLGVPVSFGTTADDVSCQLLGQSLVELDLESINLMYIIYFF